MHFERIYYHIAGSIDTDTSRNVQSWQHGIHLVAFIINMNDKPSNAVQYLNISITVKII